MTKFSEPLPILFHKYYYFHTTQTTFLQIPSLYYPSSSAKMDRDKPIVRRTQKKDKRERDRGRINFSQKTGGNEANKKGRDKEFSRGPPASASVQSAKTRHRNGNCPRYTYAPLALLVLFQSFSIFSSPLSLLSLAAGGM